MMTAGDGWEEAERQRRRMTQAGLSFQEAGPKKKMSVKDYVNRFHVL